MKKSWIILAVIGLLVVILFVWVKNGYNKMVTYNESVTKAWSDVENQYQRRMDLIPNLVNTVKGYANFEKGTLTAVVEARAKATQVTIDPTKLNAASMKQFQQAQGELGGALSRLLVTVERYPDLKANQSFLDLQSQLEGTEKQNCRGEKKFQRCCSNIQHIHKTFPKSIFCQIVWF